MAVRKSDSAIHAFQIPTLYLHQHMRRHKRHDLLYRDHFNVLCRPLHPSRAYDLEVGLYNPEWARQTACDLLPPTLTFWEGDSLDRSLDTSTHVVTMVYSIIAGTSSLLSMEET